MAAIWNFRIFHKNCKTQKCLYLETVLDRADYTDFGCHNSIRLEAEHFLNTLPLIVISFSGHVVFAVQKYYLIFVSDPLVFVFVFMQNKQYFCIPCLIF